MASKTLTQMQNRFPVGTSVGAYAASGFPGGWNGGALPSGLTAVATATVASDGSLTFAGLTAGTEYRAYALVSSEPRWVAFFVDPAASTIGSILPWASGTHYAQGQPVTNGGNTYTANDAHVAGATFSGDLSAHWTALPVSAGSGVPAGGTTGQVLKKNSSTDGDASWGTIAAGLTPTAVKTANYTAVAGDLVRVDTTSGAVTVTLPAAAAGATVGVKVTTLGAGNAVTVAAAGSDVFNKSGGGTTLTLSLLNQGVVLAAISGVWVVQADDLPLSQLDGRYTTAVENVNTVAAASTAQTLPDVTVDTIHHLTLSAASCALTFPTAAAGKSFTLYLKQDATGSRVVTWPGTVRWPSATPPVLTTVASKTDVITFTCADGTHWDGFVAALNL